MELESEMWEGGCEAPEGGGIGVDIGGGATCEAGGGCGLDE
jgi:hypothetical protein